VARKWRNNGFSTLGAALGSDPVTDTSLSVQVTHGDRFPAVSGGDYFMLSIQDAANNIEIVKVTSRVLGADTMTIVRGQEATVPQTWSINDIVELRLTAGALEDFATLGEDQTFTGNTTFNGTATFDSAATFDGAVAFNSTVTGVTAAQTSYDNTDSGLTATDVKDAIDEVKSEVDSVTASLIPTGVIVMWSGSTGSVPSGWALCNGSNGTPDLRDRFVVGAGNLYAVDATGGSKDAVVVSHTHSFSGSTGSAGSHSHSGSTNTAGSHAHGINEGVGSGTVSPGGTFAWVGLQSRSTNSAGSHSHSLSINSAGAHTHSVSGTVGSQGVSGTDQNLPPYYALAYIMKL